MIPTVNPTHSQISAKVMSLSEFFINILKFNLMRVVTPLKW